MFSNWSGQMTGERMKNTTGFHYFVKGCEGEFSRFMAEDSQSGVIAGVNTEQGDGGSNSHTAIQLTQLMESATTS